MQQNVNPNVELEPNPEEASWIREQWTLQKFAWINKEIPGLTNPSRRRLREITQPLLRVCKIMDESRLDEVTDYIQYLQLMKSDEEGDSTEAEIIRIIFDLGKTMPGQKLNFPSAEVTQNLNRDKPEKDKYKQRYVTACVKRMGFTPTRCHGGKYGFRYDEQLVSKLMQKYSIGGCEDEEG